MQTALGCYVRLIQQGLSAHITRRENSQCTFLQFCLKLGAFKFGCENTFFFQSFLSVHASSLTEIMYKIIEITNLTLQCWPFSLTVHGNRELEECYFLYGIDCDPTAALLCRANLPYAAHRALQRRGAGHSLAKRCRHCWANQHKIQNDDAPQKHTGR